MNEVLIQKQVFRKHFKEIRSLLDNDEVIKKSNLICENFLDNLFSNLLEFQNKTFGLYNSAMNEVKTDLLRNFFIANKINFAYPKINFTSDSLDFIKYQYNQTFIRNVKYVNIYEPEIGEIIIPDFIITPLVAFDSKLNRLGMGKGYYDRTIANIYSHNSKIKTIGLAYDFQYSESILPHEKHDWKLDFIGTEKKIIFLN